ncbi:MAG: hypothetical protein R3F61_20570 [Myxococcota bacterium]
MIGWVATAAAAPTADTLRAAWEALDHPSWVHRPEFDARDWERLASGHTVKRRERLDGPDRVLAARWTPATRDQYWLAIQDESHFEVVSGYVDEDLPGSTFAQRTLYQRIDLPWPFARRQWVIDLSSNRDLLAATNGTVWERTWKISDRRGASLEDADAVWVPETTGGWLLAGIDGGNLIVYHTRASVGGNIPDEAGTQWALMTVAGLVEENERRALAEVDTHYVAGHEPIERPDGTHIEPRTTPSE